MTYRPPSASPSGTRTGGTAPAGGTGAAAPRTGATRAAPPRRRTLRDALLKSLRRAAPALAAYVGVRLVGLLVLRHWTSSLRMDMWPMLSEEWDSVWYARIATEGYAHTLTRHSDLAFFPLFPMASRALHTLTPASVTGAAFGIAVVSSLAAAWGVFAVGDKLYGRRVGILLAVLWAALPTATVQWMGYTESLFTALAAWSLYAVLTGRWVWAGSLAALCGLTRPTGAAVAGAVAVTGLLTLRRHFSGRVLAGTLLAPLGWLGYLAWVGVRLGRWDGYFAVQERWHNQWDGGAVTWHWLSELFTVQPRPQLWLVVVASTLIVSTLLFLLSVADRQPLPLLLFTGLLLLITLGSGGVFTPRARFLMPGFPLLLPIALVLARASRRYAVVTVGGAVACSAYWGAYLLIVWRGSP
ncbi:hypothetical protein [Streptomyces sp. NPDC058045]|uniref:hypothetical protein n=1 Tax=Streptomyces sp. NPDC058045 TaxID=3346311 RepID=UPI0036EC0209